MTKTVSFQIGSAELFSPCWKLFSLVFFQKEISEVESSENCFILSGRNVAYLERNMAIG